jgi:hypothetical protein
VSDGTASDPTSLDAHPLLRFFGHKECSALFETWDCRWAARWKSPLEYMGTGVVYGPTPDAAAAAALAALEGPEGCDFHEEQ